MGAEESDAILPKNSNIPHLAGVHTQGHQLNSPCWTNTSREALLLARAPSAGVTLVSVSFN